MKLKDWAKSNEYSHYLSLKKQDIANRNTIRNLQLQIKKLKRVKNNNCIADVICCSCVFFEQKIKPNKGICLNGSFGERVKLKDLMSDDFGCKYFKDINSLK
jgi:hypothetical protein